MSQKLNEAWHVVSHAFMQTEVEDNSSGGDAGLGGLLALPAG